MRRTPAATSWSASPAMGVCGRSVSTSPSIQSWLTSVGSPPPVTTRSPASTPSGPTGASLDTVVANVWSGPNAVSAAAAVTSLAVEAGISGTVPPESKTTRPSASIT